MSSTSTETPRGLTETERARRRRQAAAVIEKALRDTWKEWRGRALAPAPDFSLAAAASLDALGDLAAEILVDGTMMRALTIKDGVVTLELEEATEILKVFVASMRGMLDGYGAENYLETDMTAPKVSLDIRDGDNPAVDSYTVTIQRRTRPTPHEFRQRAERDRDSVLKVVAAWAYDHGNSGSVDVCALLQLLAEAGHTVPGGRPSLDGELLDGGA